MELHKKETNDLLSLMQARVDKVDTALEDKRAEMEKITADPESLCFVDLTQSDDESGTKRGRSIYSDMNQEVQRNGKADTALEGKRAKMEKITADPESLPFVDLTQSDDPESLPFVDLTQSDDESGTNGGRSVYSDMNQEVQRNDKVVTALEDKRAEMEKITAEFNAELKKKEAERQARRLK